MGERVLFQMWGPFRGQLIENHNFYVDQVKKRLLSQFDDISGDADRFADEWLEKSNAWFDPDRHDPGDFYEAAHDESITYYGLLTEMRHTVLLGAIAGMFHEWDKQLRDWLTTELGKSFSASNSKAAIWRANFPDLFDLFEAMGCPFRSKAYFEHLDACRLIVNVHKHGKGSSFDELKVGYPKFLQDKFGGALSADARDRYLDHTNLKVTEEDLDCFAEAIIAFWRDVPENVFPSQVTETPRWLSKALDKDFNSV